MRKAARSGAAAALAAVALMAISLYLPYPSSRLDPGPALSLRLTDRNGALLREVLSDEGGRCRWLALGEMSPHLVRATLAAEDVDFFLHGGVRLASVARAAVQNARRGRVVSGASTVTLQLVRNIEPRPRTLLSKVVEAWLAVRLEHTLGKEDILVQYLNRVPYGNGAYGAEAAARLYFDKPCRQLDLAESAFLAGLPRAPSASNPYRGPATAIARKSEVLRRMRRAGFINAAELERADAEPLRIVPAREVFRAPHFCDQLLASLRPAEKAGAREVRTTLALDLQSKVEILLRRRIEALRARGISNGAAVILDNGTGDVLALAGSADYFSVADDGQVNGVLALRQPGSALKPFTYALAVERGFTAASLIDDSPDAFPSVEGSYEPRNADRRYHGLVRLRSALASSYNVPAVAVLDALGPGLLYRRLHDLGFDSLSSPPGHYGLGLTLGNGEVRLIELARAFAALANGGIFRKDRIVLGRTGSAGAEERTAPAPAVRVLPPAVAYIITHILSDADARVPTFGYRSPLGLPFPCAAKTGTSKDYRDNWTVGYTRDHTVGVWVGNFDGRPMHDVAGITGCGPLFRDIMLLLAERRPPGPFDEPPGIVHARVCPETGLLTGPECLGGIDEIFLAGTEPRESCRGPHGAQGNDRNPVVPAPPGAGSGPGLRVAYPPDGAVFRIDTVLRKRHQAIGLRAEGRAAAASGWIEWWVDGRLAGRARAGKSYRWTLAAGAHTIVARSAPDGGSVESLPVRFTVVE